MLFDIKSDPYETTNLTGDPDYADTLQEMRTLLSNVVSDLPDLSMYPESVLAAEAFEESDSVRSTAKVGDQTTGVDCRLEPHSLCRGEGKDQNGTDIR